MRRITATIAVVAAAAVATFGAAEARVKPTIRQISVYARWTGPASIEGVRVSIVRTDHKPPTGVRVCLQERNWHAPAEVGTVACGDTDSRGYHYFPHRELVYNGEQWRVHHPETKALAEQYGAWSWGVHG